VSTGWPQPSTTADADARLKRAALLAALALGLELSLVARSAGSRANRARRFTVAITLKLGRSARRLQVRKYCRALYRSVAGPWRSLRLGKPDDQLATLLAGRGRRLAEASARQISDLRARQKRGEQAVGPWAPAPTVIRSAPVRPKPKAVVANLRRRA
jgi:hypothetical protein